MHRTNEDRFTDLIRFSRYRQRTPIIDWVRDNIRLDSGAIVGSKDVTYNPCMIGAYEAFDNLNTSVIALMTGVQIGKTDFMIDVVTYLAEKDPRHVVMYYPDLNLGMSNLEKRIRPRIAALKSMRGVGIRTASNTKAKAGAIKERDRDLRFALSNGFDCVVATTNSKAFGKNYSLKYLIADEIDAIKEFTYQKFKGRVTTFGSQSLMLFASSPTNEGTSNIHTVYEMGSQGRFVAVCPHCDGDTSLYYEGFKIVTDPEGLWDLSATGLYCQSCGVKYDDMDRIAAVANGVARRRDTAGWVHRYPEHNIRTFHISSLMSRLSSLEDIIKEGSDAWRQYIISRDDLAFRTWIQERMGEPFDLRHIGLSPAQMKQSRGGIGANLTLPADVVCITVGADVQGDRIEAESVGWAINPITRQWRRYGLTYKVIRCPEGESTMEANVWNEFYEWLKLLYTHPVLGPMQFFKACVDSGYIGDHVITQCKRLSGLFNGYAPPVWHKVQPIIGADSKVTRQTSLVDLSAVLRATKTVSKTTNINPMKPIMLKTSNAKDMLHLARITDFNTAVKHKTLVAGDEINGYNDRYFDMLGAEVQDVKKGRWVKRHDSIRNEALDIFVYSMAALDILAIQEKARIRVTRLSTNDYLLMLTRLNASKHPAFNQYISQLYNLPIDWYQSEY